MFMVAGSSSHIPNYEAQRQWKEHINELYELSIDELNNIFNSTDIESLNMYQQALPGEEPSVHLERIIQNPISESFIATYGLEKANLLRNNISLYDEGDEPLDDKIEEDDILEKLGLIRNASKGDVDIANAIRVRRSVVAYIINNNLQEN